MTATGRKTRDEDFGDFFQAEGDRLRRFALFLTGDPERAKDLAQEALARVYRHWRRIDRDPGPYARKIVLNLARNEHRRALLQRRHERTPVDHVADASNAVDERQRLTAALATLPPVKRAVVVLRFYEDMSEAQIAAALDRPLGTVKSDLHRALAKLRPLLSEEQRSDV